MMLPSLLVMVVGFKKRKLLTMGCGFTTTFVVAEPDVQPLTVATTVYVPLKRRVVAGKLGFCILVEMFPGPDQLYVAPGILLAYRFKVAPSQIGLLDDATGVAGVGLTTTLTEPVELQPFAVTVA